MNYTTYKRYIMNREEIGKLIVKRRKQLNITQVELALLSEL